MLAAFQEALILLCTRRSLRESFFERGESALEPMTLTEPERRALMGLGHDELERFAASLVAKRTGELARAIPLSLRVAPSIPERYRKILEDQPAPFAENVLSPGLQEGLRTLPSLASALRQDPAEAAWSYLLLSFEIFANASRIDGEVRFLESVYRVDLFIRDVARALIPIDPPISPCAFRFGKNRIQVKCR